MVGGWWLVNGWWLVVDGWWLVVGGCFCCCCFSPSLSPPPLPRICKTPPSPCTHAVQHAAARGSCLTPFPAPLHSHGPISLPLPLYSRCPACCCPWVMFDPLQELGIEPYHLDMGGVAGQDLQVEGHRLTDVGGGMGQQLQAGG